MASSHFPSGGGGGTPAGSDGQYQYNNAGAFGASAALTTPAANVVQMAARVAVGTYLTSGLDLQDDGPDGIVTAYGNMYLQPSGVGKRLIVNGVGAGTGGIQAADLDTSDPAVAGVLWVDTANGFVVKQSQG